MSMPNPATPDAKSPQRTPQSHLMIINIPPPPPSHPETPEPGTPTSTTTSLSAISTVAIKDGHRGHGLQAHRGHAHQSSTNSIEAERADRISRLAGLERVSTLRAPVSTQYAPNPGNAPGSTNANGMPVSVGFVPPTQQNGAPLPNPPNVYFNANGQPTMENKMSTVGAASATTGSVSGRTMTGGSDDGDTMAERDEDMHSIDTNLLSGGLDNTSEAMDEDMEIRSRGGYEDRMSDDGSASLVGFGEGANSTVSGPIYQRRPLPTGPNGLNWGLERSSSGLSDGAMISRRDRDREFAPDTPVSLTAALERREPRSADSAPDGYPDEDGYYGTSSHNTGTIRAHFGMSSTRESAERALRERLDYGESRSSSHASMSSPGPGGRLGQFFFEDSK